MIANSTKLSVTPVGRAVAQSVLHPSSASQLIEYAANRADDLLALTRDEAREQTLRYALLHATYSSNEYSISGNAKLLPYQLDVVAENTLADQSENYLIERPWRRNPKAANAAMVAIRWVEGKRRDELSSEFEEIGSGVLQAMFREGAEILFSWYDCLTAGTAPYVSNEERPHVLRDNANLLLALRNLASVIRRQATLLSVGLPGEVAWLATLIDRDTGRFLLSRMAIVELFNRGLISPSDFMRRDKFRKIVQALKSVEVHDSNNVAKNLQISIRKFRQDRRQDLWINAINRSPDSLKSVLKGIDSARGREFERKFEELLNAVGIGCERLDDGNTPGAPDFRLSLNHKVQVIVELKSAEGDNMIGLNGAVDVIKGAAIVGLSSLPKVTLANPGFDANVPWQSRNVRDLALVEACHFFYGISLVACGEIEKDAFLNWLTQPGLLSVSQLRGAVTWTEFG